MFKKPIFVAATALILSTSTAAFAQGQMQEQLQSYLYKDGISSGISHFTALKNANAAEKNFSLGTLHFFHAIEGLQQDLYRYGAGNVVRGGRLNPFSGLRVPVPKNDNPEQITYEKSRQIFVQFTARMDNSRQAFARIKDEAVKFPIDVTKISSDIDGDGKVAKGESILFATMLNLVGPRALQHQEEMGKALSFNFDTTDAKWLQAYANLLSTSANFMLAFNYEKSYDVGFQLFFGEHTNAFSRKLAENTLTESEVAALVEESKDLEAQKSAIISSKQEKRLSELNKQHYKIGRDKTLSAEEKKSEQGKLKDERIKLRKLSSKANTLKRQIRELHRKAESKGAPRYADIMDAISLLHTINWEVVDRDRLMEARQNLLNVASLNRDTWKLARAETDDDKEWLPNANQTSPFQSLQVTDERIDAWLDNVSMMDQTLNGEMLIPNMRTAKGINLKKYLEHTERFDLVLFLTGPDVIEYSESGKVWDQFRFRSMSGPFGRNAGAFALWFN